MKKTLLALAITALSANAFAVDLNTGAETESYASELKVTAAGTVLNGTGATVSAGFALGTDGYARFNLSNGAKFKGNPTLTSTGASLFTVAGGGNNADYVIFKTDGKGTTISETLTLALAADGVAPVVKNGLTVVNKGAVSVSYALYETAGNASNQTGALSSKSGTLLNFAPALAVSAVSATPLEIDAIRHESKKFVSGLVGTDTSPLVDLTVGLVAGTVPSDATGTAITAASDIIDALTSKWSLTGNFSAAAASGAITTGVAGANSFTLAQDKQSAELADLSKATGTVSYKASGAAEIAETSIAATFTPVAKEGYEVAAKSISDVTRLQKNGTTVPVNLALKPGGVYSNFVRISNTDTISGTIFIKVINDEGKSASFPLNAIAGQPASLAAGASTTQLSIQSIFDAAAAKGLALTGEGKLRLEITGQTAGLSVQSYTVAKDGNSFATF